MVTAVSELFYLTEEAREVKIVQESLGHLVKIESKSCYFQRRQMKIEHLSKKMVQNREAMNPFHRLHYL